jgi:hypothetical protein
LNTDKLGRSSHHEGTKNTKVHEEKQKLDTGRVLFGCVSAQLVDASVHHQRYPPKNKTSLFSPFFVTLRVLRTPQGGIEVNAFVVRSSVSKALDLFDGTHRNISGAIH